MLVPLVVRGDTDGDGCELVAGVNRVDATASLGLADVSGVIRDAETEEARPREREHHAQAAQLLREAKAVLAMLDRGPLRGPSLTSARTDRVTSKPCSTAVKAFSAPARSRWN